MIIAHRGLLEGPDDSLQNHPDQIRKALRMGFDAEIDAWFVDGEWWLGHDKPDYKIDWQFLSEPGLWIHCKNLSAFFALRADGGKQNYFFHDQDLIVLTSQGDVWTYFGKPETQSIDSICVMPELSYTFEQMRDMAGEWLGFCTDWPIRLRDTLEGTEDDTD